MIADFEFAEAGMRAAAARRRARDRDRPCRLAGARANVPVPQGSSHVAGRAVAAAEGGGRAARWSCRCCSCKPVDPRITESALACLSPVRIVGGVADPRLAGLPDRGTKQPSSPRGSLK
jgi:hypothetical protein